MKLELAKKAYEVNLLKIDGGFMYGEMIAYAENRNKAKSQLLSEAYDCKLLSSGEQVDYLSIPVIRCKEADKFKFEGEELTRSDIEYNIEQRNRTNKLDKILADGVITYCYIRKGSYYRPNSCGYTDMRHRAGVYSVLEAISHAKSCRDLTIIPIDISEHNEMINKEIEDLQTRLIK